MLTVGRKVKMVKGEHNLYLVEQEKEMVELREKMENPEK